jgi:hypothetical protein
VIFIAATAEFSAEDEAPRATAEGVEEVEVRSLVDTLGWGALVVRDEEEDARD